MARRCLVAQLGARRHYAIPRLLHAEGMLERLHTDVCATRGWPRWLAAAIPRPLRPSSLRRMADRNPRGVPSSRIRSHDWVGLWNHLRRRRARTAEQRALVDLSCRMEFAKAVAREGLGEADAVYTFDGAALEILELARRQGLPGILDQCIAARSSVVEILEREREAFPDLGSNLVADPGGRIAERERAEWSVADVVLCGSEFVKETIRAAGGPVEKVVVAPSGVDAPQIAPLKGSPPRRPLRVLFVGEVGLRKGAHYLIEAARELEPTGVTCRLVGTIQFRNSYLARIPANVRLCGAVPRSEIAAHYEWADLFCFPSLCEGSALVTYEALSKGLPVVTTPNAGSVVQDGVDGFLIPPRDAPAIVASIERFAREGLPARAAESPPKFSLDAYRNRLKPIIESL